VSDKIKLYQGTGILVVGTIVSVGYMLWVIAQLPAPWSAILGVFFFVASALFSWMLILCLVILSRGDHD